MVTYLCVQGGVLEVTTLILSTDSKARTVLQYCKSSSPGGEGGGESSAHQKLEVMRPKTKVNHT